MPPHPLVVLTDLRNGSLDSLNAYLKRHRGIPDREVALELRKLLSGSSARTRFRLVVVDHPNVQPLNSGRPKSTDRVPTPQEVQRCAEYRSQLEAIGKMEVACEQAASALQVSVWTIDRAVKKVEAFELQEQQQRELQVRIESSLENLRKGSQIET